MPCSRDVCLGQGGTKDLKKHEQTNLHIQVFSGIRHFGTIRKELMIMTENFLEEHHLPLYTSRSLQSIISILCFLILL